MRDDGSSRVEQATRNRHDGDDVSTQVPMEAPSRPEEVPQWLEAPSRHRDRAARRAGRRDRNGRRGLAATARSSTRGSSASPNPPVTVVGVNGAGAAWTTDDSRAKLFADGRLLLDVEGLVFLSGANAGRNTRSPGARRPSSATATRIRQRTASTPISIPFSIPDGDAHFNAVADPAEPVFRAGHLLHERRRQLVRRQRLKHSAAGRSRAVGQTVRIKAAKRRRVLGRPAAVRRSDAARRC